MTTRRSLARHRKFARTQDLTVTDLFCGAGGASIGMEAAGAVIVEAANHWKVAVNTYCTNHQKVRVQCADISNTHPSRFATTDILWASPECKTHSQAAPKARKPELFDGTPDAYVERSRVTMWDVVEFAEYHRYRVVIVENVVDIGRWQPLDAWFMAMVALGYKYRVVSLNSMVAHPTPQSRDRWYVVFWQGIPDPDLEVRPGCWCSTCEKTVEGIQTFKRPDARWGKYRQQYVYRCGSCKSDVLPWVWPAAAAIDWSIPCERIGDKPMREFKNKKTGEVTWARMAPATIRRIEVGIERYGPAIVQGAGHMFERPGYYRTWPSWEPLKTLSSTNQFGVAVPDSFMLDVSNAGSPPHKDHNRLRRSSEPLFTQTALAAAGLVTPMYGRSGPGNPTGEPLPTLMGQNHHGLVTPVHGGHQGPAAHPSDYPHLVQTGQQETGLVIMGTGSIEEAKYRATTTDMPLSTVVGSAINQSLVSLPFIAELRGGHSDASSVADPLATFAAGGTHHGLVEPPGMMVRMNGDMADAASMAQPIDGPMGTLVGKWTMGVVPFLTPYYGNSTPSPVGDPMPTVTGVDRCGLVEPLWEVDDCGFRMLEPPEAGLGMGFPSTYIVGGSKRDQVRQYGQAVTPPTSAVLLGRIFEAMS